ncbi:class I SAM-dependent methyltransferase [Kitasatospora sp. NPDC002040]|uniref:class I SAM-dependent methyltransferase n=1 Tax=Kitasatospora sp. NPDC002040 TaxID=3154661 RepID=UPI00332E9E12
MCEDLTNREGGREFGSVLDVGCGTGRDLALLTERMRIPRAVGLDLQPDMLAHARARHPHLEFHQGDIRDADLGERFDLLLCVGLVLSNLHRSEDLAAATAGLARHAAPGALLLLELAHGTARPAPDLPSAYTAGPYRATADYQLDPAASTLVRRRTWHGADLPAPVEDFVTFRTVTVEEMRALLAANGWELTTTHDNRQLREGPLQGWRLTMTARRTG